MAVSGEITKSFRPQDYFDAAAERFKQAGDALASNEHGLALMLTGVSVECLLRAFLKPETPFISRHDLLELASEADFFPARNQAVKESLTAALSAVQLVWQNNHRYRSEVKLQTLLKKLHRFQLAKGEKGALKQAAAGALENAKIVMAYGVQRWEFVNG